MWLSTHTCFSQNFPSSFERASGSGSTCSREDESVIITCAKLMEVAARAVLGSEILLVGAINPDFSSFIRIYVYIFLLLFL